MCAITHKRKLYKPKWWQSRRTEGTPDHGNHVQKAIKKCHGHRKEKRRQALVFLFLYQYPYYYFCLLVFLHREHCNYSRILYYTVCILHLLVPVMLPDISGHLRLCFCALPLLQFSPSFNPNSSNPLSFFQQTAISNDDLALQEKFYAELDNIQLEFCL